MEKLYLANGEEVKIGDVISRVSKINHPVYGVGTVTENITITKNTLPKLIKAKVVTTKQKTDKSTVPSPEDITMDIELYVRKIASRLKLDSANMSKYFDTMWNIYPATALSLVLREIAITLDKKYKDHISNSPEIYVISLVNGKICKVNKAHIKNYNNFAAFRSIEDAKVACRITSPMLKKMFKSEK